MKKQKIPSMILLILSLVITIGSQSPPSTKPVNAPPDATAAVAVRPIKSESAPPNGCTTSTAAVNKTKSPVIISKARFSVLSCLSCFILSARY